jgi:hypothetical protein
MINKHEDISVGVYWDVSTPSWKLSGLIETQGQQSFLRIVKSNAEVYAMCYDI